MLPRPGGSWQGVIGAEFDRPYMRSLNDFLEAEKESGQIVYPEEKNIFHALGATPFGSVRIVIIGQDPYHGEGQAHGLSFSVPRGVPIPPSLMNIYKEIESEFGIRMPRYGDLGGWAAQGVLLLNATLTVRKDQAGSHQKKGWEEFTDAIIRAVSAKDDRVIFMLWGSYARKKGAFIDRERHLILEAPHPSPLSAHRGFLGCGHFKAANDDLIRHGRDPVRWGEI